MKVMKSKLTLVLWVLLTVGVVGAGAGVLSRRGQVPVRAVAPAAVQPDEDDRLGKEVQRLKQQNEELKRLLLDVKKKVTALEARQSAAPVPAREVRYKGKTTSYWLEMLSDRDPAFRSEAIKALAAIGKEDPRVVPALLAVLKDYYSDFRACSRAGVDEVGDPKTAPALVKLLHDPNESVRGAAAYALPGVGGAKWLPLVVKALKDKRHCPRVGGARTGPPGPPGQGCCCCPGRCAGGCRAAGSKGGR